MSSKKISQWNANRIGQAVATKAFAHILAPFKAEEQHLAKLIYDEALAKHGVTLDQLHVLQKAGVIHDSTWSYVNIELGGEDVITLGKEYSRWDADDDTRDAFPDIYLCHNLDGSTSPHVKEAHKLLKRREPFIKKMNALAEIVKTQITNRTVAQVAKNWPEITPFVNFEMGVEERPPMHVPFESLLSKYLPALPAPAEV